jgi:hypothetical protein
LGDSDEVVLGFLLMMAVIIGTGVGLCLGGTMRSLPSYVSVIHSQRDGEVP